MTKELYLLCLSPSGGYTPFCKYIDLTEIFSGSTAYAGFMGSMGNSGSISNINSWHFTDDLSIYDEAIVTADEFLLNDEMINREGSLFEYNLPNMGACGSNISWESSNSAFIAADGTVTPPTLEQGPQNLTLTATLSKGSAVRTTKEYNVIVKVPDSVIATADNDWLRPCL